jgi:hypothetical protein
MSVSLWNVTKFYVCLWIHWFADKMLQLSEHIEFVSYELAKASYDFRFLAHNIFLMLGIPDIIPPEFSKEEVEDCDNESIKVAIDDLLCDLISLFRWLAQIILDTYNLTMCFIGICIGFRNPSSHSNSMELHLNIINFPHYIMCFGLTFSNVMIYIGNILIHSHNLILLIVPQNEMVDLIDKDIEVKLIAEAA